MEEEEAEVTTFEMALRVVDAIGQIERLQVLDDLWTAYTSREGKEAVQEALEQDHEQLLDIVAEMLSLLLPDSREQQRSFATF